jgi:hypothetical protein
MVCPECGARYASETDSCEARFQALLALDHSRQEPWGSRHGQAFAAFALQHPRAYANSLDVAWSALYRIYCLGEPASNVFVALRGDVVAPRAMTTVPARPREPVAPPGVTIVDLTDFAASSYPARLDAWCRATLVAWGIPAF